MACGHPSVSLVAIPSGKPAGDGLFFCWEGLGGPRSGKTWLKSVEVPLPMSAQSGYPRGGGRCGPELRHRPRATAGRGPCEAAPMDDATFLDLVSRARRGDPVAIAELLRVFERDVRQMVRLKLPRTLRSRFDSMDFVQAVWASFFADEDGPDRFDSPRHLRAYLAGVARNKVLEEYRKRTQTRKYDIGREEPLYVLRGGRERPLEVPSTEPSPSQHLQAEDRLAQLVAGRPPVEAQVVRLRQEGLTFEEIAQRTGLGERTVRRVIEGLKARVGERPCRSPEDP